MTLASEHRERPWRIHDLAHDFTLEDVWRFDLGAASDHGFDRFLATFWRVMSTLEHSKLARIRLWVGSKLGWDAGPALPIPGCSERSIADRLATHERAAPQPSPLPSAGVVAIYRRDAEALYEVSNRTIHALLHLSWVVVDGRVSAVLAVYVKHRGVASRLYMASIWPARHLVLYPALIQRIERGWNAGEATSST